MAAVAAARARVLNIKLLQSVSPSRRNSFLFFFSHIYLGVVVVSWWWWHSEMLPICSSAGLPKAPPAYLQRRRRSVEKGDSFPTRENPLTLIDGMNANARFSLCLCLPPPLSPSAIQDCVFLLAPPRTLYPCSCTLAPLRE